MQDLYPSRHESSAQILKRQDPVVHSTWRESAPLSQQQSDDFARDGFLVLTNVFTASELALLQREAGNLLSDPAALQAETVIQEPGSREVRSIFDIHRQNPVMGRLAAERRLSEVARYLLGGDVYIHQSRLNYKPGFDGREFYWNSDFETWHAEDGMPRMRALSMSILLAENTANNGPLMLMPGSQRKFVTCVGETPDNHYRTSLQRQEYGVPDRDHLAALAAEHGIVAPTGQPGTVIIFDCNTMHGSNGNITPLPRSNVFLVYNSIENQLQAPFAAPEPRPEFIAARGAQSAIEPVTGLDLRKAA